MSKSKQFSPEGKLAVLDSVKEVGIKEAARIAGVHYTSVYEWNRRLKALDRES